MDNKLLTIELIDEDSVPKVFHNGEEITGKVRINFNWETKTDSDEGSLVFNVEHYELDSFGHSVLKGIGINRGCMKSELSIDNSAKLRAIAKHANKLANELEMIDEVTCPNCGELCDVNEISTDNEVIHKHYDCPKCEYTKWEDNV